MPSDEVVAFVVEYYDDQARLAKRYRLNSFKDGTIELVDLKTRRMFLKRIYYPEVTRARLFVGSVVNVHGRALEVVEAADLGTTLYATRSTSRAAALVRLEAPSALPAVISAVQRASSSLAALRTLDLGDLADAAVQQRLGGRPVSAASSSSSASPWAAAAAPTMVLAVEAFDSKATDLAARLEAALGTLPGVVAFVVGDEARLDPAKITGAGVSPFGPGPATLCVVKPHVVADRQVGAVLGAIVEAGFTVAGLRQVVLDTACAHEFYAAYKGVLPRYEDIVAELTEGPCVALHLRADVASFRDFCGPPDVKLAQVLRPKSLRARFGKNAVKNAVHCTDLDDDGTFEANFFFNVLNGVA